MRWKFYVCCLLLILLMYLPIFPFGFWINPPTGSMRPAITACDISVYGPSEPEVGDVMMYWYNDDVMIQHRIIESHKTDETTKYRFKGDNLDEPDDKLVTEKSIHSELYFSVDTPINEKMCTSVMRTPYNLYYEAVGVGRDLEYYSVN